MLALISLKPAYKLTSIVLIIYSFGAIALLYNNLPIALRLLLLFIFLWRAKVNLATLIFLKKPYSIIGLSIASKFWLLKLNSRETVNAVLKQSSLITSFLLVLNFECEQSLELTSIITVENVGKLHFRRLLVELKHNSFSSV